MQDKEPNLRQAEVWGKKPEVADRTLNERKYCKPCDYYYSEMFTCPICYGEERERERIIKWIEENRSALELGPGEYLYRDHFNSESLIAFIKGEK